MTAAICKVSNYPIATRKVADFKVPAPQSSTLRLTHLTSLPATKTSSRSSDVAISEERDEVSVAGVVDVLALRPAVSVVSIRVVRVITGELKSKIDRIWDAFWSGGISNPLEVIEQLTYLLFIRRLDDVQTLAERKANITGKPLENPVFDPDQTTCGGPSSRMPLPRSCTTPSPTTSSHSAVAR